MTWIFQVKNSIQIPSALAQPLILRTLLKSAFLHDPLGGVQARSCFEPPRNHGCPGFQILVVFFPFHFQGLEDLRVSL